MLNLIEKFTPEAVEATEDDGVVAIEYVLLAAGAALVVGVVVAALTNTTTGLGAKLSEIIADINP